MISICKKNFALFSYLFRYKYNDDDNESQENKFCTLETLNILVLPSFAPPYYSRIAQKL